MGLDRRPVHKITPMRCSAFFANPGILTLVDILVKSRLAYHVNRERLPAWVRFAHHSERSNK